VAEAVVTAVTVDADVAEEAGVAILQDGTVVGEEAGMAAAVADRARRAEAAAADSRELAAKPSGRIIRA
jgi:hypothetical protein